MAGEATGRGMLEVDVQAEGLAEISVELSHVGGIKLADQQAPDATTGEVGKESHTLRYILILIIVVALCSATAAVVYFLT